MQRKTSNELNLSQKIEVLSMIKSKVPYSKIAQQFKIGKGTVNRIKNKKCELEVNFENNMPCLSKRHRIKKN